MAQVTMKEMLDAGVHFGHQTHRWNPKMKPYVYSARGGIHIIDLQKSVIRAKQAADYVKEVAASGGRMIFVGTKKQAVQPIKDAAAACNQYHVTKRWLGGMLTNFTTIKTSIDRLRKIERMREKNELDFFSKKERSKIEKEYTRLCDYLDGIKDMKESPAAIFVVDLNKEHIAVAEAKKLGMKVIGIADSNTDPGMIDYPIPGNDDAIRSITLFSNMIADSYNEGSKIWAERRVVLEKESKDNAKKQATEKSKDKKDSSGDGPAVFKKASKGRKFIAAGTAEDVEIELELSKKEKEKESAATTQPETDAKETKTETTTTETKDS